MANQFFKFKQFEILQKKNSMKVTTDACILGAMADFSGCSEILDIGAGTGLLTLMQAQKFPNASYTAVEIEESGFEELVENCKQSAWSKRIDCVNKNILDFAQEPSNHYRFDGIITNPPFFRANLKSPVSERNRVRHEDGVLSMTELLACIDLLLKTHGKCFCLYPYRRFEEFLHSSNAQQLVCRNVVFLQNSPNKEPQLFIAEIGKESDTLSFQERKFNIRNSDLNYSKEFVELMRPYYL